MKRIKFSTKIFLSVIVLFLTFAICIIAFQFKRERTYKIDLLDTQLQDLNLRIYDEISDKAVTDSLIRKISSYLYPEKPRVTIIDKNGTVIYDSENKTTMSNHRDRHEIKEAVSKGKGYTISRRSQTTSIKSFYSATYFKDKEIIIRSSLPYDINLSKILQTDSRYLWGSIILMIIIIYLFYIYTNKIGKVISQLKNFAKQAEENKDIENLRISFPNNELGEISNHIVELYSKIKKSEEDKTRLKRQLTQNISHELKTPVSSIKGYLETIVTTPNITDETRDQFINRCYNQAIRLSSLLNDISTLTRMDEATEQYEQSELSLLKLLETIEAECALQLKEKDMKFYSLISPQTVVWGNYSLIYSIFRNLTDNAIAYAGTGSSITVKCMSQTEDRYVISFSDNGVGVDESHLPHLFERFYRVDKGRSRKLGGTGLGLAIVKNAVLFHGGSIYARRAETGGLEFIFTLPKYDNQD